MFDDFIYIIWFSKSWRRNSTLYSFIAVTTQIFSANMRNLIVSRNNDILAQRLLNSEFYFYYQYF